MKKLTIDYRIMVCHKCGKGFKNIKDPITKKASKYLFNCKCNPGLVISLG
jgi:hypothetical protein